MSLFGSLMADVEDDPFFGSHMRQMRQMNNMMNSMFSDPFGMLGGPMGAMGSMMGPLAIAGPRLGAGGMGAMMPFMPQMPPFNRLFSDLGAGMGQGAVGSSFSSSTVVMSSGPNGNPQVYSSSSSTKIGPNGVKETRKTLQDSRTGTKKMSIGHHIGERAHVIEREQNVYSGDAEETQEFINIEEDDAEDFDREFQSKAGALRAGGGGPLALTSSASVGGSPRRSPSPPARLALPAPPQPPQPQPANSPASPAPPLPASHHQRRAHRPAPRRPLRPTAAASEPTQHAHTHPTSASVREVYAGPQPLRNQRHKSHKASRDSDH